MRGKASEEMLPYLHLNQTGSHSLWRAAPSQSRNKGLLRVIQGSPRAAFVYITHLLVTTKIIWVEPPSSKTLETGSILVF